MSPWIGVFWEGPGSVPYLEGAASGLRIIMSTSCRTIKRDVIIISTGL